MSRKATNNYDDNTINARNVFARYSHRKRLNRILGIVKGEIHRGKILDYACGSGALVSFLSRIVPDSVIGYEPFMKHRYEADLPIYDDIEKIKSFAPYSVICINALLEHLHNSEIERILNVCKTMLSEKGYVFINVPVEIGPVVFFKETNRVIFQKKPKAYGFMEFIKTAFFGVAGKRVNPDLDFMCHKGFDFRQLVRFIQSIGWDVKILGYGPLPLGWWYGNSDVYIRLHKSKVFIDKKVK